MQEKELLQGALGEVNRQIVHLMERKVELLHTSTEIGGDDEISLPGRLYADYMRAVENRREPIENPTVVYQGEPGAYSELAAMDFFGRDVKAVGMYQFEDTFQALYRGEADYAVLPIENSSTGAIRQVYDLLAQYNYFFVGETTVEVAHALLGMPGSTLEDIKTIYSHEQGLFQCEAYLNAHPEWRKIPQADTAGSAKMVAELKDPTRAAICSMHAGEIYGLVPLAERINSNSQNTTRFVVVSPQMELRGGRDKICVSLTTTHESGSLHDILTVFAVHGINLVRLESRPIPEHNWEYMFFIEFTGDLIQPELDQVIHELSLMTGDLRVLGNFRANL